jgi:tetratricopeptide (TPR) repeat protein
MGTRHKSMHLQPGDHVAGRFRIVELIGKGGFSVVWRAYQESMHRFVALKVLKPSISTDERVVERFRREALFASHLSHPNTITLFDYGRTSDGLCYIAMEYLEGTELGRIIRNQKGIEPRRVWSVLAQASQSLAEAHKLGLIHRDIKPENLYLVSQGDEELVKVLDFGLSKAVRARQRAAGGGGAMTPLTQEGKVFGTPLYMAPEQAQDDPISPAIDVYALGHITYEMLTGRARYAEMSSAMDIMLRQIYDPPLELPDPFSQTPFAELVRRCTHKDPDERITDADELFDLLSTPDFAEYMPGGHQRDRLAERSAAHRSWHGGLGAQASTVNGVDPGDYGGELGLLHEVYQEVAEAGELRAVLINGPRGGGRTQLLHDFLEEIRDQQDPVIIHRQTFRGGVHTDRGLAADIAQVKSSSRASDSPDQSLLPVLEAVEEPTEGLDDELTQRESAFFGNLDGKRESLLANTARLFRDRAEDRPVIWALERLERIDAFTLAFLNWFFQDLKTSPAPILIVATVSRADLVDRAGLLRYMQALFGTTEPTVRRIFVSQTEEQTSFDSAFSTLSDSFSQADDGVEAIEADGGQPEGTSKTLVGSQEAITEDDADDGEEEEVDLRALFDRTLGLLAQLGDEVPVPLWEAVRDELLEPADPSFVEFIINRASQFGIVEHRGTALAFARPTFAETLREQFDQTNPDDDTRRRLAEAIIDWDEEPDRETVELAVHHFEEAGDLAAAIEVLNRAGRRAFSALDLDAAREYYLRLQRIFEQIDAETFGQLRDQIEAEPAEIWLKIGETHGALNEHGAAEDALERSARLAADRHPALRGRALKLLGDLQSAEHRHAEAEESYARAGEAFRSAEQSSGAAAATSLLGECLLRQGEPDRAADVLQRALEEADTLDLPVVAARTHFRIGRALLRTCDMGGAFEHLEAAAEAFEQLERHDEALRAFCTYGEAAYGALQFGLAKYCFKQGRTHATETRHFDDQFPTLGLARTFAAAGRYDRAADCIDQTETPDGETRTPVRRVFWSCHRGDLFLAHGAFPAALENFKDMKEHAREIGRTDLYLQALIRAGCTHFHAGRGEQTSACFRKATDFTNKYGDRQRQFATRATALFLQSASQGFPARADSLAELLEKSRDSEFPWAQALCQLYLADIRVANGALPAARELLDRSLRQSGNAGQFRLFAPLNDRLERLDALEGGQTGNTPVEGHLIGGPLPPFVGNLSCDKLYTAPE